MFAEILVSNRALLKESETFVLKLQKEISTENNDRKKRVNVRKILSLENLINKPFTKVTIELRNNSNINDVKKILLGKGDTKINLVVKEKNKKAYYSLEDSREFNLNHFKALKAKNYVEKIIV